MQKVKKIIAVVLTVTMLMSVILPSAFASEETPNTYYSENYKITKISNPTTGSGEADGLLYGDEANRINSYAWSTAYRDGYLYIGVNRNFLNVALSTFGTGMSTETINAIEAIFTRGELPAFSKDERQAMILKMDPATGETEIIYQPPYLEQYDVYLDAAYRNVIEYNGDLYFGSMGAVTTRILKVDKDDNVTVAFSGGAGASFRSSAIYNDELFFAGFDTRITDNVKEDGSQYTKMAIIRMEGDEWNRVADYKDFIKYAEDTIYQGEGGNMWDIVTYNGYLYSIIATSVGFVMFKGYEDPENENANEYGWVWTEVIGYDSEYNPGMSDSEEGYPLNGAVASSATPVVYNGKLYLGTFDYATQALASFMKKIVPLIDGQSAGVKLSDLLESMYNSLAYCQKLYEVDENDNIREVEAFTELMEGTANEYIWRFQEYDGKLFIGTFDAETMYKYITQATDGFLASLDLDDVMNMLGSITVLINAIKDNNDAEEAVAQLEEAVDSGDAESIVAAAENAQEEIEALDDSEESEEASSILDKVMDVIDMKGLTMYLEMSKYMVDNVAGADLYVTEDMENFECITVNGLNDEYNYGFRTFVATDDGLYIGTANPFYGAQVWLLTDLEDGDIIGNDVDYSLNMTKKLVSPAYAGTMVCTIVDALEVDNFLTTVIVDEDGSELDRFDTFKTGDTLRSTTTIMFNERTVLEYTMVVLGDTDCDGKVSANDARVALRISAGLDKGSNAVLSACDANCDGNVNAADARLILRNAAKLESFTIK